MPDTTTTRWRKIDRGFYRLEGTLYAVIADGYEPSQSIGADAHYEGFIGGEWASVKFPDHNTTTLHDGNNLDWFSTMREARADVERRLRQETS